MKTEIVDRIKDFLSENELFSGKPASEEQIGEAEKQLGITLDSDYKEFISLFGGSYVGVPVYGFNNCDMLSDEDIIELTLSLRRDYKAGDRWPTLNDSYVISMTGNGNPIVINLQGKVIMYLHDNNEEKLLTNSFEELIDKNIPR